MKYPAIARILAEFELEENPYIFTKPYDMVCFRDIATDNSYIEEFKAGERIDIDVLDENDSMYLEIQFPDGDVAFNVPKDVLKKEQSS